MQDYDGDHPTLRRRQQQYKPRPTAFYSPATQQLSTPDGVIRPVTGRRTLAEILADLEATTDTAQLYIVGGNTASDTPALDWFKAPVTDGWTIDRLQPDPRICEYHRGRRRIVVRMTAPFWGEAGDLRTIQTAQTILRKQLQGRFDQHATILGTPAATGLDLFERSLPFNQSFPIIAEEYRELLRHNMGQGRLQSLTLPNVKRVPGMYTLDARWMYAACLAHLPVGDPEDTSYNGVTPELPAIGSRDAWAGYRPAFYEVEYRIPDDWSHIGLLAYLGDGGRAYWPERGGPRWYRTWTGNASLAVAIDNGWDIRIYRRIAFAAEAKGAKVPNVAAVWLGKLRALRECYEDAIDPAGLLVAGAVRHLVIDTVGAWYRVAREVWHITPLDEAGSIPADAIEVHDYDDRIEWSSYEPLSAGMARYQHPEWSCMVWDRSRARLARFALTIPREDLISARNDAVVVARIPAGVTADDGRIGTFRAKPNDPGAWIDQEVRAPHTETEYQQLRARARAGRI